MSSPSQITRLQTDRPTTSLGSSPPAQDLFPCKTLPSRHYFTEKTTSRPGYIAKKQYVTVRQKSKSLKKHSQQNTQTQTIDKQANRATAPSEDAHSLSSLRSPLPRIQTPWITCIDGLRSQHEALQMSLEKNPKVAQKLVMSRAQVAHHYNTSAQWGRQKDPQFQPAFGTVRPCLKMKQLSMVSPLSPSSWKGTDKRIGHIKSLLAITVIFSQGRRPCIKSTS